LIRVKLQHAKTIQRLNAGREFEKKKKERRNRINQSDFSFSSNYCGGCNADFYVKCKKVVCE